LGDGDFGPEPGDVDEAGFGVRRELFDLDDLARGPVDRHVVAFAHPPGGERFPPVVEVVIGAEDGVDEDLARDAVAFGVGGIDAAAFVAECGG
jgi:hypothetical protein